MQNDLDNRIIKEHGLEGKNLLPNTILALQVELGECANEWRGFKHWSNRQTPKMYPQEICSYCGEDVSYTRPSPFMAYSDGDMCEDCWTDTQKEYAASNDEHIGDFKDYPHFPDKRPEKLLEEYVDCLHFFLSIANQKGWLDQLYIPDGAIEETRDDGLDGGIGGALLEVMYWLLKSYMEKAPDEKLESKISKTKQEFCFSNAWYVFVAIGLVGFGFTLEQIEAAYMDKNKINHESQANGY